MVYVFVMLGGLVGMAVGAAGAIVAIMASIFGIFIAVLGFGGLILL